MKPALYMSFAPLALAALVPRQDKGNVPAPLYFFVFGDSYTASGFNTTGNEPSPSQPLGNPALGPSPDDPLGNPRIAKLTSANGPIWAEYLTTNYNTTVTLTYDLAVSGASIPDGFTDQVLNSYEPQFSSLYTNGTSCSSSSSLPNCGWTSNSSIFASWIGINDINWCSTLFAANKSTTYYRDCLPPRMDSYFELMSNLYRTGARNFFFVNLPPLQRAPMVFQNGPSAVSNYADAVSYFNDHLLPNYVSNFTASHKGVKSVVYDAHLFFSRILNQPMQYGFVNNTCYGCIGCTNGTRAGCFWANNYHPVTQVHERLAADMVANLTGLGWPAAVISS